MTEGSGSIAGKGPRAGLLACAGALVAALGGCTLITDSFLTNDFSGDPFPINVDTTSGAIMVGLRQAGADDRVAVLDLLSPITVIDQDPKLDPSLSYVDLTLLGAAAPGGPIDLSTAVPRARFPEAQLVSLHPCTNECDPSGPSDPSCDPDQCNVGTAAAPHAFQAIIGADALAGDAVRLRLADSQIFVLPDVGGNDRGRSLNCDAVFDSPYRGGGTLVFPTTELAFGNRRITLQACLGQDQPPPAGPALRQHGADVLFVVSTSIGISILGESAYERYRLADPEANAPELATLPITSVYLPSGVVTGHRATLDRLALVATSTSNALSPCRQVYAHRLLTTYKLTDAACKIDPNTGISPRDCPCKDGTLFCAVPGILELTPQAGIDLLVVADTDVTLQALRAELRPDQPEVDGILGADVLRNAEIDVDYPHDRLLARCTGSTCLARPQFAQDSDICQINRCTTADNDPGGCARPLPPIPLPPSPLIHTATPR